MRHKGLIIISVMLLVLLAGFAYQGGQYPKLRGDRLTIDTGGDGTYVLLTQTTGPTLRVSGAAGAELLVDGGATIEGNLSSYVHEVDGQGLESYLMKLVSPAPANAKMIEFDSYVELEGNYWAHADDYNNWETTGEFLTSGPLGVGVTAPSVPFELHGTSTVTNDANYNMILFDDRAQDAGVGGGILFGGKYTDAGAYTGFAGIWAEKANNTTAQTGGDLAFFTRANGGGFSERARIDSAGNFGVALDPAYQFDVFDSAEDYIAKFFNDGGAVTNKGLLIQMGEDAQSGQNFPLDIADGDGGLEGGVESNNGTVAIYNVSDEKLKKDIEDTKIDSVKILTDLKVRDFKWKDSGKESTGFIAQEVAEAYPVMAGEVTYTRNLDTGTTQTLSNDDGTTYSTFVYDRETTTLMTITPARLLPVLVKAFQELDKELKEKADKESSRDMALGEMADTIEFLVFEIEGQQIQNDYQQAKIESLEARLMAIETFLNGTVVGGVEHDGPIQFTER